MKMVQRFAVASATLTVASAGFGQMSVEAESVIGPVEESWDFSTFQNNGFTYFWLEAPTSAPEKLPEAYNPDSDGDERPTNYFVKAPDSWLGEWQPGEPFDNNHGNKNWFICKLIDGEDDENVMRLVNLHFSRWVIGSEAVAELFDMEMSYEDRHFTIFGDADVIGYDYGEDGIPGDDPDCEVGCVGGPGDTKYDNPDDDPTSPINELWIINDWGWGAAAEELFPDLEGQEQINAMVCWLNNEAPFELVSQWRMLNDDGEEYMSGTMTLNVTKATMWDCPMDCPADFNGDGSLNILDFLAFQNAFVAEEPDADCDENGAYDILDFVCFQGLFEAGCP